MARSRPSTQPLPSRLRYSLLDAKATGIEKKGDDYLIHTDVTIRDTTRPVTFETEFLLGAPPSDATTA